MKPKKKKKLFLSPRLEASLKKVTTAVVLRNRGNRTLELKIKVYENSLFHQLLVKHLSGLNCTELSLVELFWKLRWLSFESEKKIIPGKK